MVADQWSGSQTTEYEKRQLREQEVKADIVLWFKEWEQKKGWFKGEAM